VDVVEILEDITGVVVAAEEGEEEEIFTWAHTPQNNGVSCPRKIRNVS
jgi:hypothetical protein